ncbi:MAG: aminopeptidase [Gaiellaceae bacterium]|jgi:aminopeptidase
MTDTRVERYAELLLDTCLGVQRGWQVIVWGTPWGRPLLEEVMKQLAERGAYALLRLTFSGGSYSHGAWVRHAPLDLLSEPAPIDVYAWEHCDAWLGVSAPENTYDRADIAPARTSAVARAYNGAMSRLTENEVPWVLCWYPTPALAQDAHMPLPTFEDFLYASCLIDWKAEHERISRYATLFDQAEEVRIVADGTDLRLSIAGRRADVDAGTGNMPGGEVYVCPVETSAVGTIAFTEFPAVWRGRELRGIRLRFSEGRVVDASADSEEEFLLETLDTDEGARRIGELGIGCNVGIDRYMRNVYFDEKMNGTVHIALGTGFDYLGSSNDSAIHWDIVKDLRAGGRIELDGRVVQEDGAWVA